MSLNRYSTEELEAELRRREESRCECGAARREIVHETKGFYARFGCLTCNRWDGLPELNGLPTC